jgi:hypothetical protein
MNEVFIIFYLMLFSQVWQHTPVMSVLRRQRQEVHEFEASLDYSKTPISKKYVCIFKCM